MGRIFGRLWNLGLRSMVPWVSVLAVAEKNVNVEVDEALWQRVKALAVATNRPLKRVVENALRLVVAERTGSIAGVTAPEEPPAAERGEAVALGPVRVIPDVSEEIARHGSRPTKDQLQALVDGVLAKDAGALLPHQELARATVTDPAFVSAREQERQRRAAQDRLRTAPEDESQDPGVDF